MSTRDTSSTCSAIEKHDSSIRSSPVEHTKTSDRVYRPPLDIFDFGDRYEIHVDLPGTTRDQIDVTINENVLTLEARVPDRYGGDIMPIRGEYGVGDYRRQIRLGEDIDADGLSAAYADGVLTLSLPRLAERQPRRIEVAAG
jgi:HSP20 family protein